MDIEKNIPIPTDKAVYGSVAAVIKKMEIGDSIFIEGESISGKTASRFRVYQSRHKKTGLKLSMRSMDEGVRVWRIA